MPSLPGRPHVSVTISNVGRVSLHEKLEAGSSEGQLWGLPSDFQDGKGDAREGSTWFHGKRQAEKHV